MTLNRRRHREKAKPTRQSSAASAFTLYIPDEALDGRLGGAIRVWTSTCYRQLDGSGIGHPAGETEDAPVQPGFDRRLKLEFHGSNITSDASPIENWTRRLV